MTPKLLKMVNFFSHSLSIIDFDKFNLALVLGAYDGEPDKSNGSGKSAILQAISYVLFDKTRRKKKNGVVKRDAAKCEVEFIFSLDDILYKVIRARDKMVNDSDVSFMRHNGSMYVDISCDTNTATNNKIVNIINVNYDVFVNSIYFKQSDISMFTESTPNKRKDILKSLLKVQKWDKYQSVTKDKAKHIGLKIKERTLNLVPIDTIISELKQCRADISIFNKRIRELNKEYETKNTFIINKKIEYQAIFNTEKLALFEKLKTDRSTGKSRLAKINSEIQNNNFTIEKNNKLLSMLRQKRALLKDKIDGAKGINVDNMRSKVIKGRIKKGKLQELVKKLKSEIILSDECDLCKTPLTNNQIKLIKSSRKKELLKAKNDLKTINIQLSRAEIKIKDAEIVYNSGREAIILEEKAKNKNIRAREALNQGIFNNKALESEIIILNANNYDDKIAKMKKQFDSKNEKDISVKILAAEKDLELIKKNINKLNVKYGSLVQRRNELIKSENNQLKVQKELDKLNSEYIILDKLKSYFGKDGIQSVIIENIIEELENYSNKTLAIICNEPTTIEIVTQSQNDNGSWSETFDINVRIGSNLDEMEALSGGEIFRVSLALRLALSNILSKRMGGSMKFLLLDEVSSSLDVKGRDMFVDIVRKLSNDMKILIITHDERLKDKFDDIIMINKDASGSRAELQ